MKSAFYPGAGTDIVPPIVFRSIKHWTYMDSQPRSEVGNDFYKGFSRPQFIPTLITVMNQNGFELSTTEEDVFTFYHPIHEQTAGNTKRVLPLPRASPSRSLRPVSRLVFGLRDPSGSALCPGETR